MVDGLELTRDHIQYSILEVCSVKHDKATHEDREIGQA